MCAASPGRPATTSPWVSNMRICILAAAGVQFPPVTFGGRTFLPGQANNFYIFPAVGMAIYATRTAVLISVSRMFDCGGKSIPSFNCSGDTWSATACAASMNISSVTRFAFVP